MERRCDSLAGYKHHQTKDYLIHMKQSVMDMCRRENLHQVDLLAPAEKKMTEREYHAKRRGVKNLEKRNKLLQSEGLTPRKTEFQTQKDFLRLAIDEAARTAQNIKEFEQILSEKYNVTFKVSRGRFSYLHPDRDKYITERMLGTRYESESLLKRFAENALEKDGKEKTADIKPYDMNAEAASVLKPNLAQENPAAILFVKSDLRLVVNLQDCVKAQQNAAYANKVKLSNLKEMAKTVAYIQEHGYDTREALEDSFVEIQNQASSSRKNLKTIEDRLRATNEQIHYTGQYLANKSVYREFCSAKNKGHFRKEHATEITLYETARKFLTEHSVDGRLPSMKRLMSEKEQLLQQKEQAQETYHYYQEYKKKLGTVRSNVDLILGQPHKRQASKQFQILCNQFTKIDKAL